MTDQSHAAESSERSAEGAHPISGHCEPDAPLRNAASRWIWKVATSDSFLVRFWSAFAVLAPIALLLWWLT